MFEVIENNYLGIPLEKVKAIMKDFIPYEITDHGYTDNLKGFYFKYEYDVWSEIKGVDEKIKKSIKEITKAKRLSVEVYTFKEQYLMILIHK